MPIQTQDVLNATLARALALLDVLMLAQDAAPVDPEQSGWLLQMAREQIAQAQQAVH